MHSNRCRPPSPSSFFFFFPQEVKQAEGRRRLGGAGRVGLVATGGMHGAIEEHSNQGSESVCGREERWQESTGFLPLGFGFSVTSSLCASVCLLILLQWTEEEEEEGQTWREETSEPPRSEPRPFDNRSSARLGVTG